MGFLQRFQVSCASFLIVLALAAPDSSGQTHKPNRKQKKHHVTHPVQPSPAQFDPSYVSDESLEPKDVPCLDDHGNVLDVSNEQVLLWKRTTKNQFLARAHIKGVVKTIYDHRNGHAHFQAVLGKSQGETIEVIYNEDFGDLPRIVPGMTVEACGDYITSNAPTPRYTASPDGAIIHWIHRSNNVNKHKNGYVALNNIVYGMGSGKRQYAH